MWCFLQNTTSREGCLKHMNNNSAFVCAKVWSCGNPSPINRDSLEFCSQPCLGFRHCGEWWRWTRTIVDVCHCLEAWRVSSHKDVSGPVILKLKQRGLQVFFMYWLISKRHKNCVPAVQSPPPPHKAHQFWTKQLQTADHKSEFSLILEKKNPST